MVAFYNQGDQDIYNSGIKFRPQQKYLLNQYTAPTAQIEPVPGGITNTNAFNNSGGDGFSVYNPDPNSIVNRNADSTRYNNLMENSYLKGGSNSTVPKYLNEPYNPSIKYAQAAYDQANQAINQGKGNLISDYQGEMYKGPKSVFQMREDANDMIMDNRQNYGAQGQFETVDSPLAYNSETELNKFKDNYPEYYTKPEPTGLARLGELASNFIPGAGIARFIGDYLPVNRRSILENELSGKGIMVNDIGQIVQGQGDYNTAGNVMAGYNPTKMTAATFDKRIAKIQDTLENKYGSRTYTGDKTKLDERIKAIEEAKANFLNAQDKTDLVFEDKEAEKKKKKKKGNIITRFLNKKKETKADKIAAETGAGTINNGGGGGDDDGGDGTFGLGSDGKKSYSSPGSTFGTNATTGGPVSNKTGKGRTDYMKGGRAGYFFGGRVNFKDGGLASIL